MTRTAIPLVRIEDADDPRIAPFRDIRERDLARRDSFIAEGSVVLDQLLASTRFAPAALLVLENRLEGLEPRLARLPEGVPVYVAGRAVIDAIAGFPMHRGVLALGTPVTGAHGEDGAPEALARAAFASGRPLLCAVGIANHDNVGALFRAAAAFGAGAVLLDGASCHPLYRKAIRVSVGTVLTLPFHRGGTGAEMVEAVLRAGFEPLALTPAGATRLADLEPHPPKALFVGAEGPGLSPALIARMRPLAIAQEPSVDSLNVATAAAIVLSRLYENRMGAR